MIGDMDAVAFLKAILVLAIVLAACAVPVVLIYEAVAHNSVGLGFAGIAAGAIVLGAFGWFLSQIDLSH